MKKELMAFSERLNLLLYLVENPVLQEVGVPAEDVRANLETLISDYDLFIEEIEQ